MSISTYERIRRVVEQLTHEERRQLREELGMSSQPHPATEPTGAALIRALDADPPDPQAWEAIERIIEDECERVDPSTW